MKFQEMKKEQWENFRLNIKTVLREKIIEWNQPEVERF